MAPDVSGTGPLGTETPDPATEDLDLRPLSEQIAALLGGDALVVPAVAAASASLERAIGTVVDRLRAGGHLVYVGAGSAGRTAALDAAEVGPTFGVDPDLVRAVVAGGLAVLADAEEGKEDDAAAGAADLRAAGVTGADAVVAVSASGGTPYTLAAALHARSVGAYTVAVVANLDSPLGNACDEAVVVRTGPEAIAGSTRLRAATAQKIVLNTISTLAMVGLGRTYGNRMVAVRPDNAKLRERARRALADIVGVPEAGAEAALEATEDAPTALVVLLTGADPRAASEQLRAHGGRVRDTVRALAR